MKKICLLALFALPLLAACARPDDPAPDGAVETAALEEMELKIPLTGAQFNHLQRVARKGDVEAQVIVALIYTGGYGAAKNFNEAQRWLRRAQSGGSEDAGKMLTHLHRIMRQDPDAADHWVRAETEKRLNELNKKTNT